MLEATYNKKTNEIIIRGDFFELDHIYFLIQRISGNYGIDSECVLDGYTHAASILQALNHEIRQAQSGNRELHVSYNGIGTGWIAPAGTPAAQIVKPEGQDDPDDLINEIEDALMIETELELDDFYEMDEFDQADILLDLNFDSEEIDTYLAWLHAESTWYFSLEDYPKASDTNTSLQFRLPVAEALLHALILRDLLAQKDVFMQKYTALVSKDKNGLGAYELFFCRHRMPSELLEAEILVTEIFAAVYTAVGDEHYDKLQAHMPPVGAFQGMTADDVHRAEQAVAKYGCQDIGSVLEFLDEVQLSSNV